MEIRLHALEMSRNILFDKYFCDKEVERINWESGYEKAKETGKVYKDFVIESSFPNEQEVIKKAKLFSDFIFN